MKRKIIITSDGSSTIHLPEWNESYHSKHGAIQEAYHVFIKNGLDYFIDFDKLSILEMGFGTGLNTFITLLEAQKRKIKVNYTGIEKFPLDKEEWVQLNYFSELETSDIDKEYYEKLFSSDWEKKITLHDYFTLYKVQSDFNELKLDTAKKFNLIYFDAFGPRIQPELWTINIFEYLYYVLEENGVLVTYCCKGEVKRTMQAAGFITEKLPGPPGKREMLRAFKKT